MLEFDDIQHILLTRAPALTGRYEFLSFRNAAGGRAWLAAILETVQSAAAGARFGRQGQSLGDVAFTWNGLRALGVDEASLATFPEEFKQGMVARAEMLGDTGDEPSGQLGRRSGQPGPPRHRRSCSPATRRSASAARRSTPSSSRSARASKCSRRWTWRRRRRSTMRTIISVIATGSRSRSSKAPARSRRPAPARR